MYVNAKDALDKHDRSFDLSSTNFMYFDKSENSFRNFDDCYTSWEKKAKTQKNVDMYRVFNLNPDDFKKATGGTDPRHESRRDYRKTALYMLTHL